VTKTQKIMGEVALLLLVRECAYLPVLRPVKATMTVTQTKERCVVILLREGRPAYHRNIAPDSVHLIQNATPTRAKHVVGRL
jgi:hypothetical protein